MQKFAPSLKYHIHYGSSRRIEEEHLEDYDIIITSYGNMRIDIEEFQKYQFQYVILDESQSIKNPGALVTRAAHWQVWKPGKSTAPPKVDLSLYPSTHERKGGSRSTW